MSLLRASCAHAALPHRGLHLHGLPAASAPGLEKPHCCGSQAHRQGKLLRGCLACGVGALAQLLMESR